MFRLGITLSSELVSLVEERNTLQSVRAKLAEQKPSNSAAPPLHRLSTTELVSEIGSEFLRQTSQKTMATLLNERMGELDKYIQIKYLQLLIQKINHISACGAIMSYDLKKVLENENGVVKYLDEVQSIIPNVAERIRESDADMQHVPYASSEINFIRLASQFLPTVGRTYADQLACLCCRDVGLLTPQLEELGRSIRGGIENYREQILLRLNEAVEKQHHNYEQTCKTFDTGSSHEEKVLREKLTNELLDQKKKALAEIIKQKSAKLRGQHDHFIKDFNLRADNYLNAMMSYHDFKYYSKEVEMVFQADLILGKLARVYEDSKFVEKPGMFLSSQDAKPLQHLKDAVDTAVFTGASIKEKAIKALHEGISLLKGQQKYLDLFSDALREIQKLKPPVRVAQKIVTQDAKSAQPTALVVAVKKPAPKPSSTTKVIAVMGLRKAVVSQRKRDAEDLDPTTVSVSVNKAVVNKALTATAAPQVVTSREQSDKCAINTRSCGF